MIYVTADHHFGHANIIKYCSRPFESVEKMTEVMVERWNGVVGPDDVVWHLGDFALMKAAQVIDVGRRLTGKKFLLRGNHDHACARVYQDAGFELLARGEARREHKVNLSHRPPTSDELATAYGPWLHGHVHGSGGEASKSGRVIDVGVDLWGFTPVALDDLRRRSAGVSV